jgi:hypothetical protein
MYTGQGYYVFRRQHQNDEGIVLFDRQEVVLLLTLMMTSSICCMRRPVSMLLAFRCFR